MKLVHLIQRRPEHDVSLSDGELFMVRLSTSALAGDPDPNPRVFNFLVAILGSAPVSATR